MFGTQGQSEENKRMKRILMMAAVALGFSLGSVQAAPLCTSVANTFTALKGLGDCQVGGALDGFVLKFNDITPSGNPDTTQATAQNGTLVSWFTSGPTNLLVTFTVGPSLGVNNGGLVNADYTFNYTVTPILAAYAIYDAKYDVDNIYAPNGQISGYKQLKDINGGVLTQASLAGILNTAGPVSSTSGTYTFGASLGKTFVQDTLQVIQFGNDGAYLGNGVDGVLTNTLSFQAVPEPMSFVLAGAGLVGLGILRKRRSKTA
jgi:hypothetical protein